MNRLGTARVLLGVGAAVVIAVFAAPRAGVERAQGAQDATATQPDAAPSVIYEGGPGRVALNGPWTLRSDRAVTGVSQGFYNGTFTGSTVTVPNSANAKRVEGATGSKSFQGTVAWYATQFSIPKDGRYALRFESVNHKAVVYVDGRRVVEHTGTYLPFEVALDLSASRSHTISVRVDWRDPAAMKLAAWHRTWFNFGGINREVSIRPVAASDLAYPTVRTVLASDGAAHVDLGIRIRNHAGTERSITARGSLTHAGQKVDFEFPAATIPAGKTQTVRTTAVVASPALWAPGSPNLYDVKFEVPDETDYVLKTGLREIRKDGRKLLINGKQVRLRGASLHEDALNVGDALDAAQMDEIVANLKAIGANATRSQHPISPALLERLDAAGILLWLGIGPVDAPGNWTSRTPALVTQSKQRVLANYRQAQTHPSVIAWNLANEVANNGHSGGQAKYIDDMAQTLHRIDPGRLVALDVWGAHPPKVAGPMYRHIDAIGDTNYIGWYEKTNESLADVKAAIRAHITAFARTFKDKIVAVTEFGAEANARNATTSPGGFRFQANLLRAHIDVYRSLPYISGMLVWNLRDFAVAPSFAGGSIRQNVPDIQLVRGINQKGLYTYDDRQKLSARIVSDLFAQIAANGD